MNSVYRYGPVALIPFITAGDPDLSTTSKALKILDSSGSDLIELGVPYSDPLADGPVIQVVPQLSCPIALFTYYNPILKRGIDKFMSTIEEVGVRGAAYNTYYTDRKNERNCSSFRRICIPAISSPPVGRRNVSPCGEKERGDYPVSYHIKLSSEHQCGPVSSIGVTGARASVSSRVQSLLQEIKEVAGWGADGVIVGSAIVKLLGGAKSPEEGLKELEAFTRSLKSALL
ncbi:hypothetical protein BHE74_00048515 [Ensete ventricosum]|nr:hypothetical protein BHE74_00048515 [Ensete ventricosum]